MHNNGANVGLYFSLKTFNFFHFEKFQNVIFFDRSQKIYFLELEKNEHSFDVKN